MFLDHWVIMNVQICVCMYFNIVCMKCVDGADQTPMMFLCLQIKYGNDFFGCFVIDHCFDICRERLLKKMKGMMYQMVAVLTPSLRRLNACTWCVIWLSCHKSCFRLLFQLLLMQVHLLFQHDLLIMPVFVTILWFWISRLLRWFAIACLLHLCLITKTYL